MTSTDCPRFFTCSAAVCPLAPDWRNHAHLPGERVCKFLLDTGKAGAAERYSGSSVFAAVAERCAAICRRHSDIARKVRAAASTGFMGGHLIRKRGEKGLQTCADVKVAGPVGDLSRPETNIPNK
jgi:hypothetical protein